jgi:DNA-binding GntR family transcriptional regulator
VPRSERLLVIEATRRSRGEITNHSVNYLAARTGRRLSVERLSQHSIVNALRDELGIVVTSATQSLTALAAPADIAEHLAIAPGAPVLYSEFVMLASARPILAARVYYRADRSFFTATLTGPLAWRNAGFRRESKSLPSTASRASYLRAQG